MVTHERALGNENVDEEEYDPSSLGMASGICERVSITPEIQNCLLAITCVSPNESQEAIRDSSIKGYVYVAEVDETKKKVRLLSPQPGMVPSNALILGSWPESVVGLVA